MNVLPSLSAMGRGSVPVFVPRAAGLPAAQYADFASGHYWGNNLAYIGSEQSGFSTWLAALNGSFARGSSATRVNASGLLESVSSNVLRFDYDPATLAAKGILIEGARTNVALWNRDLTNAAWTPTNIAAAKDQVGVDGAANAASSIAATAGNGTILQAITLASSARYQAAYVKRLAGSGAVKMTMDNGTTWTAITVTASWARVAIPTQTIANPTIGFQIVSSGDAIAVDYVGNENGTFASSAIATTSAAVTRAADNFAVGPTINSIFSSDQVTAILKTSDLKPDDGAAVVAFGNGARELFYYVTSSFRTYNGSSQLSGAALTMANANKAAIRGNASSRSVVLNGGTISSDANALVGATVTTLHLGSNGGGNRWLNGHVQEMTIFNFPASNSELQRLTA